MAQQDETSLHDELVDTLLPDPAKYLLKRYESRERRHKYHLSVVFFGSSAQVAVDKSWAAQKRLPPTEEVSWDKDKAVYSLRGFHAQHCLVSLKSISLSKLDHRLTDLAAQAPSLGGDQLPQWYATRSLRARNPLCRCVATRYTLLCERYANGVSAEDFHVGYLGRRPAAALSRLEQAQEVGGNAQCVLFFLQRDTGVEVHV